jgi:hypothetical protein
MPCIISGKILRIAEIGIWLDVSGRVHAPVSSTKFHGVRWVEDWVAEEVVSVQQNHQGGTSTANQKEILDPEPSHFTELSRLVRYINLNIK